jgi:hypothetical protein
VSDLALFGLGLAVFAMALVGGLLSGYVWFERVYERDFQQGAVERTAAAHAGGEDANRDPAFGHRA